MNYYLDVLKKYAVFSGRSRRSEYWVFFLIQFIIGIVLSGLGSVLSAQESLLALPVNAIYFIYIIGTLIPGIAVTIRRLHDTDRSGWWIFIGIIPIIGAILLIIWFCMDGTIGSNSYGPNPKEPQQPTAAPTPTPAPVA